MTKERFIQVLLEEGYDKRVAEDLATHPNTTTETEEWIRERARSVEGQSIAKLLLAVIELEEALDLPAGEEASNGPTQQKGA